MTRPPGRRPRPGTVKPALPKTGDALVREVAKDRQRLNKAIAMLARDEIEAAATLLQQVLEPAHGSGGLHEDMRFRAVAASYLGEAYRLAGQSEPADQAYRSAAQALAEIEADVRTSDEWVASALTHSGLRNEREANESRLWALRRGALDPNVAVYFAGWLEEEHPVDAERVLREAAGRYPDRIDIVEAWVRLLAATHPPDAVERLSEAADLLSAADRHTAARSAAEHADKLRMADDSIGRARSSYQRGDYPDAVTTTERILAKDPAQLEAMLIRGYALLALGERQSAAAALRQFAELGGEPELQLDAAAQLRLAGEPREALRIAQGVAETDSANAYAQAEVGMCFLDLGQSAQAAAALRRAVDLGDTRTESYAELASALIAVGTDPVEIGGLLDGALRQHPGDARLVALRAHVAREGNQPGVPIDVLREAVAKEPDNPQVRLELAFALEAENRVDDALSAARAAVTVAGDSLDALLPVALLFDRARRWDDAIALLERADEIAPLSADVHTALGGVLSHRADAGGQGQTTDYAAALEHLDIALQLEPGHAPAQGIRGAVLTSIGKPREAASALSAALIADPGLELAQDALRELVVGQAASTQFADFAAFLDPARSTAELRSALEAAAPADDFAAVLLAALTACGDTAPANPGAAPHTIATLLANAGASSSQQGQFDAAATVTRVAMMFAPDQPTIVAQFGELLRVLDRPEDACQVLSGVVAEAPETDYAWASLGAVKLDLGRLEDGLADLGTALRLDPDYAWARVTRGHAWLAAGRPDQAVADFEKALANQPTDLSALSGLAEALRQRGDVDEAIDTLERALTVSPEDSRTQRQLGYIFLDKGARSDAVVAFRRASAVAPADPVPHIDLAQLYNADENVEAALEEARQAVELGGTTHAGACWVLGDVLSARGEFNAAVDALRRAVAITPGEVDIWNSLTFALLFHDSDDAHQAVEAASRALGIAAGPWEQRNMALALQRSGDPERAAEHYREALLRADAADDEQLDTLRAWCHYGLGEFQQAREIGLRLLRHSRLNAVQEFDLALYTLGAGNIPAARNEYLRAIDGTGRKQPARRRGLLYVAAKDIIASRHVPGADQSGVPDCLDRINEELARVKSEISC